MKSLIIFLFVLLFVSCSPSKFIPKQRDSVTVDKIAKLNVSNAYQIVSRLRWSMLVNRLYPPSVYVNGMRYGGTESLKDIPAEDVQEIEFVSSLDATTRWGAGHSGGVIAVCLKK